MPKYSSIFDERICPECGKKFFKPISSIYKIKRKGEKLQYYCSYTCWNKCKESK